MKPVLILYLSKTFSASARLASIEARRRKKAMKDQGVPEVKRKRPPVPTSHIAKYLPGISPEKVLMYNKVMDNMNPERFLNSYRGILGEGYSAIRVKDNHVEIYHEGPKGYISRIFKLSDRGDRYVVHNLMSLNDKDQGKGLGALLLRDTIESYKEMGIKEIKLTANIDVGGYAWAKYGFKLDLEKDPESVNEMKNELRGTLADLVKTHAITPRLGLSVERILNKMDSDSLWRLSDMTAPIGKAEGAPLGKVLLKGTHWSGSLNLTDEKSMTRFNRYMKKRAKLVTTDTTT